MQGKACHVGWKDWHRNLVAPSEGSAQALNPTLRAPNLIFFVGCLEAFHTRDLEGLKQVGLGLGFLNSTSQIPQP